MQEGEGREGRREVKGVGVGVGGTRRVSEKGNYPWLKTLNHNTFLSANQTSVSSAHAIYGMCTHRPLTLPATRCAVQRSCQWGHDVCNCDRVCVCLCAGKSVCASECVCVCTVHMVLLGELQKNPGKRIEEQQEKRGGGGDTHTTSLACLKIFRL